MINKFLRCITKCVIATNVTKWLMASECSWLFFRAYFAVRNVHLRPSKSQPFYTVLIATVKIKWQNGGDGPYFVHYRALLQSLLSLLPYFLSQSLFFYTFCFLSFGFYPLPSSSLSLKRKESSRIQESVIGLRQGFLSSTFCTSVFVLHANPRPDKARFLSLSLSHFRKLCRLVMGDSGFSNAAGFSFTPTYHRLLPLLFLCSTRYST